MRRRQPPPLRTALQVADPARTEEFGMWDLFVRPIEDDVRFRKHRYANNDRCYPHKYRIPTIKCIRCVHTLKPSAYIYLVPTLDSRAVRIPFPNNIETAIKITPAI